MCREWLPYGLYSRLLRGFPTSGVKSQPLSKAGIQEFIKKLVKNSAVGNWS